MPEEDIRRGRYSNGLFSLEMGVEGSVCLGVEDKMIDYLGIVSAVVPRNLKEWVPRTIEEVEKIALGKGATHVICGHEGGPIRRRGGHEGYSNYFILIKYVPERRGVEVDGKMECRERGLEVGNGELVSGAGGGVNGFEELAPVSVGEEQ